MSLLRVFEERECSIIIVLLLSCQALRVINWNFQNFYFSLKLLKLLCKWYEVLIKSGVLNLYSESPWFQSRRGEVRGTVQDNLFHLMPTKMEKHFLLKFLSL